MEGRMKELIAVLIRIAVALETIAKQGIPIRGAR